MGLLKMTKPAVNPSVFMKTGLVRFRRFSENQPIDIDFFGEGGCKKTRVIVVNFFMRIMSTVRLKN
jgi:hypothetical protein